MARESQVSVTAVLEVMDTVLSTFKAGKISAAQVTTEMAEMLGISVDGLEKRYKRFSAQPRYRPIFNNFNEAVGGVEFVTVGQQGRPGVDDSILAKYAAKFAAAAK